MMKLQTAAVLFAAAVLCCNAANDIPEQCGLYNSKCDDYGKGKVSSSLVVSGTYSGDIELVVEYFSDNQCNSADVSIQAVGTWVDLGVNNGVGRNWQIDYAQVTVTPNTADWADQLNKDCPCFGSWKQGKERILTGCDAGSCPNSEWLGGLSSKKALGIQIGRPAFGFTSASKKEIAISFADSEYSTGMALANKDVWQTIARAESCGKPSTSDDFCGLWTSECAPNFVAGGVAATETFVYEGPKTQNTSYATGIYKLTTDYFSDSRCAVEHLRVETEATLRADGENINIEGALMTKFNAPFILVTPMSKAAVKALKNDCPCGDASQWSEKQKRRLTACTLEECNVDFWNNVTLTGGTFHGNLYTVLRDDSNPELLRTPVVATTFQAKSQSPSDLGHPHAFTEKTCEYPYDGVLSICGEWENKCHSTSFGDLELSIGITGSAGDASHGTGTGAITRERLVYHHGSACADQPFIAINDEGFWSDLGASNNIPGARNILIRYVITEATVYDDDTAKSLNNHFNGCPCNGTWKAGVPRTISHCPPKTCPDKLGLFGNGAIGTPGYGVIRDQENTIRISSLHDNPTDGFDEQLGLTDYPMAVARPCVPPPASNDFGGEYFRPCDTGTTQFDFQGAFKIKGDHYEMEYKFYPSGFGCVHQLALKISQSGDVDFEKVPPQIPNGRQLEVDAKTFEVTPYTQAAVDELNKECPCNVGGSIWQVNKTTTLKKPCPPNTCNHLTLIRQPFGGKSYGIALRHGRFLRVSKLDSDKKIGFGLNFTAEDYYWVSLSSANSGGSGSHRMDAGGVLLLIAFFGVLAYLAIGMAINYHNTRVPRIPHVEFWSSLPGLISDGFAFTLSGFGLLSRQKQYAAMTNVQTDTSSYGAL